MATAHAPFWGPKTAAVDWCETNYAKTPYVAEFWNTLSSLGLCAVALVGLRYASKYRYPQRITLSYVGVFCIGVGSVAFHGTLTRVGQALDELSMCWTVSVILFSLLLDADLARWPYAAHALFAFDCALTFVYCYVPFFFPFFIVMFGGMLVAMLYRSYTIARHAAVAAQLGQYHVRWLRFLAIVSWGVYLGGLFCLWMPENLLFCVPNGWLQMHAVYHLTCAWGVYSLIVFTTLYNFLLRRDGVEGEQLRAATPEKRNAALLEVEVHTVGVAALYAVVIRSHTK